MKLYSVIVVLVLTGNILFAQDDPGAGTLDQATEAKLQAQTPVDLSGVIALCLKAEKEGLTGDNLRYAVQLLASCRLQRGMYLAQQVADPAKRPADWKDIRNTALADLEGAVQVIKEQVRPYLLIVQLNLLEEGNPDRANEALDIAEKLAQDEPLLLLQIVSLKASLEKDLAKREALLKRAASSGDPKITLLHSISLLELKRPQDAVQVLEKLFKDNDNDPNLAQQIIHLLAHNGQTDAALKILDALEHKSGEQQQNFALLFQKAALLAEAKRYAEALPLLNELRHRSPDNVEILLLRSEIYIAMDDNDNALKDVDAALRIKQDNPLLLLHKIKILSGKEHYEDALDVIKDLESLDPKNQGTLAVKTEVLRKIKRYDEAVDVIQTVLRDEPEAPQWLELLFATYAEQKAFDKAVKLAEEQIKKATTEHTEERKENVVPQEDEEESDDVETMGRIVLIQQRSNMPEDEKWVKKLVSLYVMQKRYSEANKVLDECIKREPDRSIWAVTKAALLADEKRVDDALAVIDSFIKTHLEAQDAALSAVAILSDNKRNKEAMERLKPLLEKNPDDLRLLQVKSQICIAMALHSEAVKTLENVIKREPMDSLSLNNLSWLYSTSPVDTIRDGKRALELAEQACKLTNYKEAFIISTLAAAYAETGNFDKAKEWSQKGLDLIKSYEKNVDKSNDAEVKKCAELLENLQKEYDTYKQNLPYREALEQ